MRHIIFPIIIGLSGLLAVAATGAQESVTGTFPQIKAKTFAKNKFVFPDDVRGTRLNILFLPMSADQDNGTAQQEALIAWHEALAQREVFTEDIMPYHFPVLAGVPFFVKGIIRGAMRDMYEGIVPLDQASVLFIKDLDAFADAAGLTLDEQATIVITTSDAKPLQAFKGPVSPQAVDDLLAAIEKQLGSDPK
jgi:hypothetical protein